MSAEVPQEMARHAIAWQAEEAKEARARSEAVRELLPQPPAPAQQPAGAPTAQAPVEAVGHEELATLAILVIDMAAQRFGGDHLALKDVEAEKLKAPMAAVLKKYLPDDFALGPEWALIGTAAAIYGPKLIAGPKAAGHEPTGGAA